eukprot:gene32577-40203_t
MSTSITSVNSNMFLDCYSLKTVTPPDVTSVTIPPNVTEIGGGAFAFTSLVNVIVPDTVLTIESYAFYAWSTFARCTSLANIDIPPTVQTVGQGAFEQSGLVNVVVPNGVVNISQSTFAYCYSLTSVSLPRTVKNIAADAFYNDTSLQCLEWVQPAGASVDPTAFYKCPLNGCENVPTFYPTLYPTFKASSA